MAVNLQTIHIPQLSNFGRLDTAIDEREWQKRKGETKTFIFNLRFLRKRKISKEDSRIFIG